MTITIPPEALEAAARAMREEVKRTLNVQGPITFDDLPKVVQDRYRSEVRAACLALIQSWPNANWDEAHTIGIILPLTENTND